MIGMLTTYAPLLVKLGMTLIDLLVRNGDENKKMKKAYLEIIQVNVNRQLEILKMTNNVDLQLDDLRKK